jgi:outer membrane immunogenic protein
MKNLTAVAFVALSSATAFAADLPARTYTKAPIEVPVYSWNGFYVGANAGYTWGDNDINVASVPVFVNTVNFGSPDIVNTAATAGTAALSQNHSGFIGGAQAGYNWQFSSLVAGVEADIQGIVDNNRSATAALNSSVVTNITASQGLNWLGTVRGRLGVTIMPTLLAYVTGGLAYGEVNSDFEMSQSHVTQRGNGPTASGLTIASLSELKAGWTVGGGMEWAFAPNWSVKAEYLYYDLGGASYGGGLLTSALPDGTVRYSIRSNVGTDFTGNIIRAGVNYRWGGPVIAKY